jgi:hypothetical protein
MSTEMTASWLVLLGLGAFHGINPGMGWLFAVALGMQERRRGAVVRAMLPLGAGHLLAVIVAVGVALAIGAVMPLAWMRWLTAAVLVSFGARRAFRHRHPRWTGMRVGMGGLTLWSFLMATAHGAGLMVVPLFVGTTMSGGGHAHHMPTASAGAGTALLATGLHTLGYLTVTALIAAVVFERIGVGILRRAWLNLDLIWAATLVATGVLTVTM